MMKKMKMITAYTHKKGFIEVNVPKKALVYGKASGVSRKQAENAYIQRFMGSARKSKDTKYKGSKGFEFTFK